jgi:phosphoglycolate phosphatase
MPARLLVFDLDGTLHWTEKALASAIQRAMADMGVDPAPLAMINSLYGEPLEVFCNELLDYPGAAACSEFREGIRKHQEITLPETGELYPGTVDMLTAITDMGFSSGVCSNSSRHYIDLVLEILGIGELVTCCRGIEHEASKTGRIADLIAASGSELTLVAGDRYHDMEAASENSVPGIWCKYGYGSTEEGSLASYTALEPGDITSIASCSLVADAVETLVRNVSGPCPCVGISGRDASGKTTFAGFLCRYLEARGMKTQLISIDDFHNPRETRRCGSDEIRSYIDNAFDLDRICIELLGPAKKGEIIRKSLTLLDLDTDSFDRIVSYDISPETVLVLEGVLLFREPIERFIDARVYLDAAPDVLLDRAFDRDGGALVERYLNKYIPVQNWFDREHDPRGRADLVVENSNPNRPAVIRRVPTRGF